MECEASELWCHLLTAATEHFQTGIIAAEKAGIHLPTTAAELKDAIGIGSTVVLALFSIAFALWKYWRYNDRTMHIRLAEYMDAHDKRLRNSAIDFHRAIRRPQPGQGPEDPHFANAELRAVLKERNWYRSFTLLSVERSADQQLSLALEKIDRQINLAKKQIQALQNQEQNAHLLRGAIASSAPEARSWHQSGQSQFALTHIRNAKAVRAADPNNQALELEAIELQKMFRLDDAEQAYTNLVEAAKRTAPGKDQDFQIARAKRALIEIKQRRSIVALTQGNQPTPQSLKAYTIVTDAENPAALRNRHGPHSGWDAIDSAELHYLAALVCRLGGATRKEPRFLDESEREYQNAAFNIPTWSVLRTRYQQSLLEAAESGLRRVARARTEGVYDFAWVGTDLVKQPYYRPAGVGDDGDEDGVPQTA